MLLPSDDTIRPLIAAVAALRVAFGKEFGERRLVLPNATFFPDVFQPDLKGAARLVARMQAHAGMADIPLTTVLVSDGASGTEAHCGSGSCAPKLNAQDQLVRVVDLGDEWRLQLAVEELRHPVALTTLIARSLATIFLVETEPASFRKPQSPEVCTDLVAVGLGFGVLLLEGAHIYSKSCGGPSVVQLTALTAAELSLCLVLFAKDEPKALREAQRHLSTTQSDALSDARAWLNGNRELADQLQHAPELLLGGAFELAAPRAGWFGLLSRSKKADPFIQERLLPTHSAPNARPQQAPDDDLKALVSEALAER
jgi:hypothetical protein